MKLKRGLFLICLFAHNFQLQAGIVKAPLSVPFLIGAYYCGNEAVRHYKANGECIGADFSQTIKKVSCHGLSNESKKDIATFLKNHQSEVLYTAGCALSLAVAIRYIK